MTERAGRLAGYRHRRDHFFAEHPHSPLREPQRAGFAGLDYFPERADLALNLPLDESGPEVGEAVEIPTSDGKAKSFSRVGRIRFDIDGEPAELTVFKDSDRGSLFIPFRDASAGEIPTRLGGTWNLKLVLMGRSTSTSTMPTTHSARMVRGGAVRYRLRRTSSR
jgi:uncharacterized protein (DUF1684 family)